MTEEEQYEEFMRSQVDAWLEQVGVNEDIKVPKEIMEFYFRLKAKEIREQPIRFLR